MLTKTVVNSNKFLSIDFLPLCYNLNNHLKGGSNMTYVLIHLISAIILVLLAFGLQFARSNKQISTIMVINRILYVILIVTGIRLAIWTFSAHAILTIIKFLFAISLIGMIEMLGARKIQSALTFKNYLPVILLFLIVFILGFSLH